MGRGGEESATEKVEDGSWGSGRDRAEDVVTTDKGPAALEDRAGLQEWGEEDIEGVVNGGLEVFGKGFERIRG